MGIFQNVEKQINKAVIIGAGFSGLCLGIKLKEQGIHDFIILEKANEVGGTWRENTYPGAECDVPSALYSYSFEPYPFWEYKWSHQPQILEYLKHCAKKYGLYKHIRFEQTFESARWNESNQHWIIKTKSGDTFQGQHFIPAIGQLHHPSRPNFDGLDSFSGPSFHSARWNHKVDLTGKRIGVIGNAASAVQFVPQIAKQAGSVTVFQRSANWMLPKQDRLYKEWEKKLVRQFPVLLKVYRNRIYLLAGGLFFLMKKGNQFIRKIYQKKSIRYIKKHIKNPETVKKLTPSYPMGAKRILFSDDYYEALAKDHVHLETSNIEKIIPEGIKTSDKKNHELDVLIFSTGFKTNPFLMGLEVIGKNGIHIQEAWKDGPKNYLGMSVHGFPNLFLMYGPNTNLGHNSIILMIEAQVRYIIECVQNLDQKNWKSLEVKSSAMNQYHEQIQERLKNMVWAQIKGSWYQSPNGNIPNNWPGRTMEYSRITRKVNFSDFEIGS